MKRIGLFIAFLAVLALVLPSLTAQDAKKDADKTDKKVDAEKDEKKDQDKTDKKGEPAKDEKKDSEKKAEPKKAPEKLVYGNKFITKIVSISGESSREFSVESQELDPKKVFEFNKWKAERSLALAKQQSGVKDVNGRNQYQQALATFQNEMAKRSNNLTTGKPLEVRATENAKVRTLFLPVEFNDVGEQKKWTKKEIEERKDKTGLPGYSADFEALKQGQWVEIYMAKQAPMPKVTAKKKKGPADDDPPAGKMVQEFVLIVIRQEGGK